MPSTETPRYDLTAIAQTAKTLIDEGYHLGVDPIELGADTNPVQATLLDISTTGT